MSVDAALRPPRDWPAQDLEGVERCPVCDSEDRRLLYEGLHDRLFGAPGRWTVYSCLACGSAYLDPRPTRESIGRAYERYFTHEATGRENLHGLGWWRRVRRAVANGYLNRRFGTDYRPSSRLGGWLLQFVPGPRHSLDALGRHLPRPAPGMSLLDVGCGNGDFLDIARRAGWRVMGVEPDPVAVEVARSRGLDVRLGTIEALAGMTRAFDVITLSHVIEHVHDPLSLLMRCRMLLRPNGWIWIDTPNLDSFGHRRYGAAWRGLEPPRHLVLFTIGSLTQALRQAGFGRVEWAPWRPVASGTYAVSEAIRSHETYSDGKAVPLSPKIHGVCADVGASFRQRWREFLTLTACGTLSGDESESR